MHRKSTYLVGLSQALPEPVEAIPPPSHGPQKVALSTFRALAQEGGWRPRVQSEADWAQKVMRVYIHKKAPAAAIKTTEQKESRMYHMC